MMQLRGVMTNKDLERAFLFFNIHYFDGKLQKPSKISFANTGKDDGTIKENVDGCFLHVHEGLKVFPNMAVIALIHEMAHLKLRHVPAPHAHGMVFQAEIMRLLNAGAYEGLL